MRDATAEDVSRLTAIISGAALDARLWDDFVEELHHVSGGVATHILGYDTSGLETGFIARGYDPASLASYASHYHEQNVWAPGFLNFEVGRVVDSRDMASDEVLLASEFYHDWVKPNDDIRLGGGAMLAQSPAGTFLLGGNIPARFGDAAAEKWLRFCGMLTPHLMNAWETARVLTSARIGGAAATVIVTDHTGRVVFLDDAENCLADERAGVSMTIRGGLRFRHRKASDFFERLASQTARSGHLGVSMTFASEDHRIAISTLNPDLFEAHWPAPLAGSAGPAIAVVITRGDGRSDAVMALRIEFGLSPGEAEVALALSTGRSLADIAESRGVSIHTIRNQVKSAMSKCGVARQSQLVARILRNE